MQDTELRVGEWLVHLELNTLSRDGEERRVGPKVMAVLGYLVERGGGVVGKQELVERVWQGAFTSDEAVATVLYELRKALGDDARQPRYVETIRGSGYRLIAPIQNLRSPARTAIGSPAEAAAIPHTQPRRWKAFLGAIALILLTATAFRLGPALRSTSPSAEPPPRLVARSLAVLPLSTLAGGSLQEERFANALTEEVSAALARQRPVELAAALDATSTDPWALRQTARNFNVDAVLEGSVYHSRDRLLVTVQLIELETGIMLWGHSYERQLGDPLLIQLELARDIAKQVDSRLD